MASKTASQAARRIREHARRHGLAQVAVVLHGGEPLLLGHEKLRELLRTLRSVIDPVTRLGLTVHTNGVRLDEQICDLFAEYGVRVGVSLDGDRTANDRHRKYADGRSSHERVIRALALLNRPDYRHLYAGILCTVDVRNDPDAVYEAVLAQAPPRFDLLLPHATWDSPPPRPSGAHAPYAAWLGRIHARWVQDGRPIPIRLFDSLRAAWEGRPSGSEAVGLDPVDLLVIEADGHWEQADSLKTAYAGAPETGLDVFAHSVDEAAAHPGLASRRQGIGGVSHTCRSCSIVRACGGGLYAHRYQTGSGFDNPSVYCEDLKVLVPQVTDAPPAVRPRRLPFPQGQDGETPTHQLDARAFDLLASGPGDVPAMTTLADAMYSVNRALLGAVAGRLKPGSNVLTQAAADGWELLYQLDKKYPQAVREVLSYPFVQAWAAHCLKPSTESSADLDRAHLGGIAAAAASRAGIETDVLVPVRDGALHLPAVGSFIAVAGTGPVAPVRVTPSGVDSPAATGWLAVREITTVGTSVALDDVDPFRDCSSWTATGRLPGATWVSWQRKLPAAITRLDAELPHYAYVLQAGLRSVVPVLPAVAGVRHSGSAQHAFGAVAAVLPDDPSSLAELLLHEMQHAKLSALCTLVKLFDRENAQLFSVPWRADPRPFEGVLHGAYAHLAVAELWRARALATPDGPAAYHYRSYRAWVEDGIATLQASGILLPSGERFVEGMRATVRAWGDD